MTDPDCSILTSFLSRAIAICCNRASITYSEARGTLLWIHYISLFGSNTLLMRGCFEGIGHIFGLKLLLFSMTGAVTMTCTSGGPGEYRIDGQLLTLLLQHRAALEFCATPPGRRIPRVRCETGKSNSDLQREARWNSSTQQRQ